MKILDDQLHEALEYYRSIPFHFNSLDLSAPNENAHTRILRSLLSVKVEGHMPFLASFISKVGWPDEVSPTDLLGGRVSIRDQAGYVDCRIDFDDRVIIIENKIHGAIDGHMQLFNYFNRVAKEFPNDKIKLIYLTRSGGCPSPASLPLDVAAREENLECWSYKDDILPWLEEDVLPNCGVKNEMLIYSLRVYIDHLRGLLGTREDRFMLADPLARILGIELNPAGYKLAEEAADFFAQSRFASDDEAIEDLRSIIQIILRKIERMNPFIKANETAQRLKWMFKNDPYFPEDIQWNFDEGRIAGIRPSCFSYYDERYLRIRFDCYPNLEIHMNCGIIDGPYFIIIGGDLRNSRLSAKILAGLENSIEVDKCIKLPVRDEFAKSPDLMGLYRHIRRMVECILEIYQSSKDEVSPACPLPFA